MPVDLYVGGSEHAVLHLLYARFWHKVLFDLGVVKHPEPFMKLVHQGIDPRHVVSLLRGARRRRALVRRATTPRVGARDGADAQPARSGEKRRRERWATEAEIEWRDGTPVPARARRALVPVTEKMSKSRGNVVNPDGVIDEHGTDALRVYEMFMGPLEQMKPWQTSGIQGVRRFLDRARSAHHARARRRRPMTSRRAKLVHQTVKKVGEDIDALRLNTAVSAMMILANHLDGARQAAAGGASRSWCCCVAPVRSTSRRRSSGSASGTRRRSRTRRGPASTPRSASRRRVEIGVQVNGKVRGRVTLAVDAPEAEAREAAALADPNVAKFIEGKTLEKVVYVPGKILNFIVR